MSLDDTEDLMQYIGHFQKDSFRDAVVSQKQGKNVIKAKLVGLPRTVFRPVRAPYTRQFLKHLPKEAPKELKAAHDNKSAPKTSDRGKKPVQKSSRRSKRQK